MVSRHASYTAELGFKVTTPGSAIRHPADCAPSSKVFWYIFSKHVHVKDHLTTNKKILHVNDVGLKVLRVKFIYKLLKEIQTFILHSNCKID